MSDIALVFHWPPDTMDRMPLDELTAWRERARERYETKPGTQTRS
ncbi:MAG: GpE family phage tail protein [Pseudohongiellaceae bacterium]